MYVVIDIGGSFIKYAHMNETGEIVYRNQTATPLTSLDELSIKLFEIVDQCTEMKGIAISCPGTVDPQTGIVYKGGSLPFLDQVNLKELFQNRYHIPTSVENDGKSAALAELWLGSIKDVTNGIVLVLGSGIGGGIIINQSLYRGSHLSSGEVSFMITQVNRDTNESVLFGFQGSAVLMVKKLADILGLPEGTSGKEIFPHIHEKNEQVWKVFRKYCQDVAVQVINLQYIFDPEKIAIGGGISAQPIVVEQIKKEAEALLQGNAYHYAQPNIVNATFQNDANLYGALYHHFTEYKQLYKTDRNEA